MRLRTRALLSVVCAAAAVGLVSGCQSETPAEQSAPTASPDGELADKVPDKIREDGVLTVGIDPVYPPMVYLQRGEAIGADLDIMTAVAQRLGLRPQFVEDSYALLIPGVAGGRFEAAVSALSVDDNDLQNATMVTYFKAGSQLAVRPPAKKRFRQGNLCGKKVTVLEGTVQNFQLVERSANCTEDTRKPIRIVTFQSQAKATEAVINRKAYATLAESPAVESAVIASNGRLVANGKPFEVNPYGIAVAPQREQLARVIRKTLTRMIKDGAYQQILDQWGISGGAIKKPEILTRKDIEAPTSLVPSESPSESPSPTPSAS